MQLKAVILALVSSVYAGEKPTKVYGELCPPNIVPSQNLTLDNIDSYLGLWWTAADVPE